MVHSECFVKGEEERSKLKREKTVQMLHKWILKTTNEQRNTQSGCWMTGCLKTHIFWNTSSKLWIQSGMIEPWRQQDVTQSYHPDREADFLTFTHLMKTWKATVASLVRVPKVTAHWHIIIPFLLQLLHPSYISWFYSIYVTLWSIIFKFFWFFLFCILLKETHWYIETWEGRFTIHFYSCLAPSAYFCFLTGFM